MEINRIKIILIGSYAVGKSCVINALMKKEFGKMAPTIGLQFQTCKIKNKDNKEYILSVFDTAGEERYKSLISMYFQKVNIILLVIDVTSNITEQLSNWLDYLSLHKEKFMEGYHIIIVFNKVDLVTNFNINYNIDNTIKLFFSESNMIDPLTSYSTVVTSCKNDIGFDDLRSIVITNIDKIPQKKNDDNLITLTSSPKKKKSFFSCLW